MTTPKWIYDSCPTCKSNLYSHSSEGEGDLLGYHFCKCGWKSEPGVMLIGTDTQVMIVNKTLNLNSLITIIKSFPFCPPKPKMQTRLLIIFEDAEFPNYLWLNTLDRLSPYTNMLSLDYYNYRDILLGLQVANAIK